VKTTYREKIQSIAKEREVPCLVHFTQFNNLRGIVKHGLLSRKTLAGLGYMFDPSDHYRLDGCDEAVSVSISRVNEPVFTAKRHRAGRTDWVVLALRSAILWTHDCRFSWRNAAKKEITDHRFYRGGHSAFSKMFEGSDEDRNGLRLCDPTDIQAEVQVLEPITPDCILGAVVYRPELAEPVRTILAPLPGEKRRVVVDSF
jgi:hypothetical protein